MSDTPKTDASAKAVGSLACQWKTGAIDAVQFERAAQAEFDKLAAFERENAKAERVALTSYIIARAAQYSQGSWDGTGVAEDMLKGAGIKAHEVRRHECDPYRRKRLLALLKKP